MGFLVELIREYGFGIVFLNVFVEQLGAPIPAYPVLVVTGALEGADWVRLLWLVAVAVSAALIADLFWYQAGKAYGHRVLGRICRISLSPDACIRQTETVYGRWGARSLLVAKFVPGFASIASALAGVMGTPLRSFVLYDGLGALIWVGSAVYLGSLFSSTVEDLLGVLTALGQWGLLLLAVALGLFIVRKWWQRHRMVRSLRMPRMSVRELAGLHAQGMQPTVIDVRALPQYRQGHIPVHSPGSCARAMAASRMRTCCPSTTIPTGWWSIATVPMKSRPRGWRASCSARASPTCARWWAASGLAGGWLRRGNRAAARDGWRG